MRHYLVIANRTLGGTPLTSYVHRLIEQGDSQFMVIVPATAAQDQWATTEKDEVEQAQARLDATLKIIRDMGAQAQGRVTDPHPVAAAMDALREGNYDEIILSTLPAGVSRWLGLDLPSRLERATEVPITHLVGENATT